MVCRRDEPARAWIFLAIHETTLGPAVGGTRMRAYPSPADALADAMRLAEAMTDKWAILDLPFGGGKCVIAPDDPLDAEAREALFQRYGRLLESLRGAFYSGVDVGVSPADMAVVARATGHVHGVDFTDGSTIDPGPYTARGRTVPADDALGTPCDVFAPCAIGGILDEDSVERLECRIVAGSANAQLVESAVADRLHERGIVYAPDFVANGGGAAALGLIALGEDEPGALRKVDGIGETVRAIFREAAASGESPLAGARRIVERKLSGSRTRLAAGSTSA